MTLKFKNRLIYILLLLSVACKSNENPVQPEPEVPSGQTEPVSITLPKAVFTEPEKVAQGEPSPVIMKQLIALMDATPEASSVYVSIYAFQDYSPLVDALTDAGERGVELHIMFDMSSHNESLVEKNSRTLADLKKFLPEDEGTEYVLVDNDAGGIAINHNKFVLFSEVETEEGSKRNVIFQTSHNFTESDTRRIQDAVILSHEGLYQAYLDYWKDMRDKAQGGMINFEYREFHDPAAGITAFFYPKRKNGEFYGGDTIIEILDAIDDPSSSVIKTGMSGWTNSRVSIVEKLDELLVQGAHIEVVTKSSIGPEVYDGLKALEANGAFVRIYNMEDPDRQRINIHAKFMFIEGIWKGEETTLVITGSQNFSKNALRYNNETTLLFQDHEFFNIYKAYFEKLKTLPGVCCSAP